MAKTFSSRRFGESQVKWPEELVSPGGRVSTGDKKPPFFACTLPSITIHNPSMLLMMMMVVDFYAQRAVQE
jgi:hypothetical protein